MENTPTQKTPEQIAAAWSKMGLAMRETDMRLQAMAQAAIAKIKDGRSSFNPEEDGELTSAEAVDPNEPISE